MKLIAGRGNRVLAERIAHESDIPLTDVVIKDFNDGEIFVRVMDNVRGEDVFVIQPTCNPVHDNLMELLIIIDALRRGFAKSIIAVIPYFGYARQDRKEKARTPITARLVANMLESAGAHRILTLDLHAGQIQGFFNIPVDNMFARSLIIEDIRQHLPDAGNLMIVSPDHGGVQRARGLAEALSAPLAIIDKRRPQPGVAEAMNIIGDPTNKHCILIDDMVDTGGTLCKAAEMLKTQGALSVHAYATHGVLSKNAIDTIKDSALSSVVVTDTIKRDPDTLKDSKIRLISVSSLLGKAIVKIRDNQSVSKLFDPD